MKRNFLPSLVILIAILFGYICQDTLAKKGYSVSVGFEGSGRNENNVFDVEDITDRAEKIMCREKWKYYASNGISTNRKYSPPEQPLQ